jgi:hypothetical protein
VRIVELLVVFRRKVVEIKAVDEFVVLVALEVMVTLFI